MPHPALARRALQHIPASRIREVANAAMGASDVLAFWFGEPDVPTPAFIVQAAHAALDAGDLFYLPNLGLPALREALASYVGATNPCPDSKSAMSLCSSLSCLAVSMVPTCHSDDLFNLSYFTICC